MAVHSQDRQADAQEAQTKQLERIADSLEQIIKALAMPKEDSLKLKK